MEIPCINKVILSYLLSYLSYLRGKFRSPVGCNGDFNQHRGGHNGRGSFGRVGFGHGRGGGEAGNIRIMSSTGHTVHVHLNGHGDVDFATHATAQEGMQKNGSPMGRKIHLLLIIKVISMKMFIFVL